MPKALLVLSTFPDVETAARIARELVAKKLAACANVMPQVKSIYRWQGKIEESSEAMVFFKTTRESFAELQNRLRSSHPYEVPEIIALPIADGLPDYLRWIAEGC